jgi:hypothetical protein
MHRLTVVLAAASVGVALSGHARAVASAQQDALVKLLAPPMTAVAKLVAVEAWSPKFDEFVQNYPAAAPLGAKWNKSAPAWQKARSAVGARLTRLVEAYAASGDLTEGLQAALAKNFPGNQAAALLKVLTGPDGPAIIHFEALTDFLVGATHDVPSKPGGKAEMMETNRLATKFEETIGSEIPRPDPAREKTAAKFWDDALGTPFHLAWFSVLSRAETEIRGAINLMMFDDRAAIEREITQAIATVK